MTAAVRQPDEPCEEQTEPPEGCLERGRFRSDKARSAAVSTEEVDGRGLGTGRGIRDSLMTKETRVKRTKQQDKRQANNKTTDNEQAH